MIRLSSSVDRIRTPVSDFDYLIFILKYIKWIFLSNLNLNLKGADGKKYRVRYTADEFGYHPVTEEDTEPDPV